jgi:TRAP-type mannitol/chloroaromatic compound transport system substrate-binding protein
MRTKHWRDLFKAALMGAALAVTPLSASAQETYEFSIQTAVPNSSLYFKLLTKFADQIETMSGGRLKAEVLPSGAIVAPFEIQSAVSDGVVKAGFAWPNYWSGKNPAYILFTNVPANTGMDQRTLMAWYYDGEGQELYRQLNQDIMGLNTVSFLLQPMGPDPLGWFNEPIESMDDFRNVKYRSPPGIAGQTYKEMGVSAVALPGAEVVPAAQRGVIDAAEWIGPADDRNLGLSKIWKHYYLQGLHQQSDMGELIINKEFWDSLPKDLQAIIEVATLAQATQTLNSNIKDNAEAVRYFQEQEGVTIHDTPESYYREFIEAQNKVTAQYAANDEFFAKVLKSQNEFADMVYPYWSRVLELYTNLVQTAHETKQSQGQK